MGAEIQGMPTVDAAHSSIGRGSMINASNEQDLFSELVAEKIDT